MLSFYFRDPKRLAAMESNHLSAFLNEAAVYFHAQGYFFKYARASLGYSAAFGDWLKCHTVRIDSISDDHVVQFFDSVSPDANSPRRKRAVSAVNNVLSLVRKKHPPRLSSSFAEKEVERFSEFLRTERGLARGTVEHHQRGLLLFFKSMFGNCQISMKRLSAESVHKYVTGLPHRSQQRNCCAALRAYFRFLRMNGICTSNLQQCLPVVRSNRMALSPKWLGDGDAAKLLQAVDRSTKNGRRNYAAILCMMDLGVRVGDVAVLRLDDIDWTHGTIRISNHKRGRPYDLPLPDRTGVAIADYLRKGRPATPHRNVFLRHTHPIGQPASAASLKRMVSVAWKRAGFTGPNRGTHILRHTMATCLKHEGQSLKSIADVLGHHSLQTTTLYAQVDLPALRRVAGEWPEVTV
ncbi:site-specific integrase [Crateriforma spongiae]|uniref:site-specific integrase n=1 Tax=Crateriforma spongiae TaxID=2724528 RepID=UPI0039AF5B7D